MTHQTHPTSTSPSFRRHLGMFLLLLALVTAACGSSVAIESASPQSTGDSGRTDDTDGDSVQDNDDGEQTDAGDPDGVNPQLTDEEVVAWMLLDDSLLGEGWIAEPKNEENDPEFNQLLVAVAQDIDSCSDMLSQGFISLENGLDPLADNDNVVRADSPTYARGNDNVSFGARVYPTAADAQKPFDIIDQNGFAPCMSEAFPELLQRTFDNRGIAATVADVTYETPAVPGHESFSFDLTMRVDAEGEAEPLMISFEIYVARQDRGVVIASINQMSGDVDSTTIISAMEERLITNMGR